MPSTLKRRIVTGEWFAIFGSLVEFFQGHLIYHQFIVLATESQSIQSDFKIPVRYKLKQLTHTNDEMKLTNQEHFKCTNRTETVSGWLNVSSCLLIKWDYIRSSLLISFSALI